MQSPPHDKSLAGEVNSNLDYVNQTAALLDLSIPPEFFPSVVEHFERVQAIAQPVLAFDLPSSLEPGFRFYP